MKPNFGKYFALIGVCLLIIANTANAQMYELHKKRNKTFKVSPETNVQVTNKYGNIQLVTWKKDSVKIEFDVRAIDDDSVDVVERLDYIDLDATSTQYFVIAKTVFKDSKGLIWKSISDVTGRLFDADNKTEINYLVYVPEKCNVKIENSFGNVYLSDFTGSVDITLFNGDLKAGNLSGETHLDLKFGKAAIASVKSGRISVGYGEAEIQKVGKLNLDTKSSKIILSSVYELRAISKRDKYFIDSLGIANFDTDFSTINIAKLGNELIAKSKYGVIKAASIMPTCKMISMNSNASDIEIYYSKESSCNLTIVHKKTGINISENYTGVQKQVINKDTEEYKTSGIIGASAQPFSECTINAVFGNITINSR